MTEQNCFITHPVHHPHSFCVTIPGSKSITNRALLLAALSDCKCTLTNVLFSADSRALLQALTDLGIPLEINEAKKTVTLTGCGNQLPATDLTLNAQSAGTAARFLTALLAFSDHTYTLTASEQMKKRPMAPLIHALREKGISLTCTEEEDHLPLRIEGASKKLPKSPEFRINIDKSSQFLSALMMTGVLLPDGITIVAEGARTALSYVYMTEELMKSFGVTAEPIAVENSPRAYRIPGGVTYHAEHYIVEPDLSGACYFYAAAALLGISVTVTDVHPGSCQGDYRFLDALAKLGCTVIDTPEGVCVTGPKDGHYPGLDLCMSDFSDQTMTMTVLALFADTPTHIRGVGHIRGQECDRMNAILTEVRRLGGDIREDEDGTGIIIRPVPLHGATIETYDDHRMAMSFALVGLRVKDVIIQNPACCKKTFENYFDLFRENFMKDAD